MSIRRFEVLVVHGVGEQRKAEHLETLAVNFLKAVQDGNRGAGAQVLHSGNEPRHSAEHGWRRVPIVLRWRTARAEEEVELHLREVHWADLDVPMTPRRWLELVGWALSVSGVRIYSRTNRGLASHPGVRRPAALSFSQKLRVRLQLLLISMLFFLMLVTLDVVYFLLQRFSIRAEMLRKARGIIYDYLGDVKLYQDWFARSDDCLEALGEKSRVAIRRRMVRELVDTASSVKSRGFDGYYIIAHSLGTIVAYNALMEPEITLPNYLTQEEWDRLPPAFKKQVGGGHDVNHVPCRPLWLPADAAIDRNVLLSGLKGLVTLGSPLDKFATLWPAVVPINDVPVSMRPVPWINVADVQDIVAGTIDQLGFKRKNPSEPGLHLENFVWGDQWSLFTAHTSYWTAVRGKVRLANRLLDWIEGGSFREPEHNLNPALGKLLYWITLIVLGLIPTAIIPTVLWFACRLNLVPGDLQAMCPGGSYSGFLVAGMCWVLGAALVVSLSCAVIRRIWEEWRLAP